VCWIARSTSESEVLIVVAECEDAGRPHAHEVGECLAIACYGPTNEFRSGSLKGSRIGIYTSQIEGLFDTDEH